MAGSDLSLQFDFDFESATIRRLVAVLLGAAGVFFLSGPVAYYGFAPAALPLFAAFGVGELYHLGFLAVGLLVLGALARRLYRRWIPLTDLLTTSVTAD